MSSSIVDLLARIGTLGCFRAAAGRLDPHHGRRGGTASDRAAQPPRPRRAGPGTAGWADTLTQVTAHKRRHPQGDSMHLSITGSLPDATVVLVYGGLPTNRSELDDDLPPDTTTLSLAALRHAATTREASA